MCSTPLGAPMIPQKEKNVHEKFHKKHGWIVMRWSMLMQTLSVEQNFVQTEKR
jgi:hypothetical protein